MSTAVTRLGTLRNWDACVDSRLFVLYIQSSSLAMFVFHEANSIALCYMWYLDNCGLGTSICNSVTYAGFHCIHVIYSHARGQILSACNLAYSSDVVSSFQPIAKPANNQSGINSWPPTLSSTRKLQPPIALYDLHSRSAFSYQHTLRMLLTARHIARGSPLQISLTPPPGEHNCLWKESGDNSRITLASTKVPFNAFSANICCESDIGLNQEAGCGLCASRRWTDHPDPAETKEGDTPAKSGADKGACAVCAVCVSIETLVCGV